MMELLAQPGIGVQSRCWMGSKARKKSIHIVIFRFDRGELEAALKRAVRRGVQVHALVAFTTTGQGGEKMLRALEMRLLADGVSVSRTATDLVRYHDKLLIIDSKTLFMLGFNFTYIDMDQKPQFRDYDAKAGVGTGSGKTVSRRFHAAGLRSLPARRFWSVPAIRGRN